MLVITFVLAVAGWAVGFMTQHHWLSTLHAALQPPLSVLAPRGHSHASLMTGTMQSSSAVRALSYGPSYPHLSFTSTHQSGLDVEAAAGRYPGITAPRRAQDPRGAIWRNHLFRGELFPSDTTAATTSSGAGVLSNAPSPAAAHGGAGSGLGGRVGVLGEASYVAPTSRLDSDSCDQGGAGYSSRLPAVASAPAGSSIWPSSQVSQPHAVQLVSTSPLALTPGAPSTPALCHVPSPLGVLWQPAPEGPSGLV
jgi:hypothetical protein